MGGGKKRRLFLPRFLLQGGNVSIHFFVVYARVCGYEVVSLFQRFLVLRRHVRPVKLHANGAIEVVHQPVYAFVTFVFGLEPLVLQGNQDAADEQCALGFLYLPPMEFLVKFFCVGYKLVVVLVELVDA